VSFRGHHADIYSEPNFPTEPNGFFSTTTFTNELLAMLKERKESTALSEKPFFGYLAFTAPHFPLQAPKSYRDKYKNMYNDGPTALKAKRLARLKQLGLVAEDIEAHPMDNPHDSTEWKRMSKEERILSARAMETVLIK
jgi:arylsulfatase A-like enzyme